MNRCNTSLLGLVLAAALLPASADARNNELDHRARRAAEVFRELRVAPDSEIPEDLIARSRCIAVVPSLVKAAWFVGGHYGKGVLSCRSERADWSPPVHVMLTGGGFGLQFGASSTDVVLFFMTERSVRSLLSSKIKLSGDAGVAAGPVGRSTSASTDIAMNAEIYSYARSRGLFVGVSIEGGYLGVDGDDTRAFYGRNYRAQTILFEEEVTSIPRSAWEFLGALPQGGGGGGSGAGSDMQEEPRF
ncbi:MAG TPA: lipid-binding SYLF domain-containing protein [Candidatus Limnocylindrales bacterium]|nr:lipid-binding SYLF domain-containing protein [Candidatus Limnocylindrales bacterium]